MSDTLDNIPKRNLVDQIMNKVWYVQKKRKSIEKDWIENAAWLNGNFSSVPAIQRDRVEVNMFWALVRSIVPAIYFRDPDILVEPENPIGIDRAPLMQAVLQYRFRKMNVKRIIQKMIIDAMVHSKAYCKVGYVVEDVKVKIERDDSGSVTGIEDDSDQHDLAEHKIEFKDMSFGSHSTIDRVSPRNIFIDGNATSIEDAQWIAEEILTYVKYVKDDPNYSNTRNLRGNFREKQEPGAGFGFEMYEASGASTSFSSSGLGPFGDKMDQPDDEQEMIRIYEFWDRRSKRVITVAPGHNKVLRDVPWPYPRYPYFDLCLTVEVPDEPYPMPILTAIKPQQRELNDIRSYQLDFIKRAVTKYAVDASIVDDPTLAALKRGEGVPVIPINGPPAEAIQVIQGAPMNPEVHMAEEKIKRDITEISGVTEFMSGTSTPRGTTATEQRQMASAQSISIEWMVDQVEGLVVDVARLVADLEMKYTDKKQVVRITGTTASEWRHWTKDDIEGDYEISIHAGTQLHIDAGVRAKQALDRFNLFAPIALKGGPIRFYQLAKDTLEATGAKNIDQYINKGDIDRPPQDPWAEEQLFSIGGTPEISNNDYDDEHLRVHMEEAHKEKDDQMLYKRMKHVRDHQVSKMHKEQAKLAQMNQMFGMPSGAPQQNGMQNPEQTNQSNALGSVNGPGVGQQNPIPGRPANPDQYIQGAPSPDSIMRATSTREVQ